MKVPAHGGQFIGYRILFETSIEWAAAVKPIAYDYLHRASFVGLSTHLIAKTRFRRGGPASLLKEVQYRCHDSREAACLAAETRGDECGYVPMPHRSE